MPKLLKKSNGIATYAGLVKSAREAFAAGKSRALDAVEREKVCTSWEVGKLVQEHILLNKERAEYGQKVIQRLSADLGMSKRELDYMVEFARAYPIVPRGAQLSWSHYRALLAINEPEERGKISRLAKQKKWTRDILRREIKKLKSAKQITVSEAPADELLVPIKGILDTYRIVTGEAGPWQGKPLVDAGFSKYEEPDPAQAGKFKEGNIVQLTKGGLTMAPGLTGVDLYTYRAYVVEVTDGDTIWMLIDLGFGILKEHLRLRGIDAPEITSRAGLEAKQFVERELKKATHIIITSTKSDKYDRYLADVFYTVKGVEHFLNNRLLHKGLAHRV